MLSLNTKMGAMENFNGCVSTSNPQIILGVHGNRVWTIYFIFCSKEKTNEFSRMIKKMHGVIGVVGDVNVPAGIAGDTSWFKGTS
jgi:hypothetical protein